MARPICAADNFNIDFGGGGPSDGFAGAGGQSGFWNAEGVPGLSGYLLHDLAGVETTIRLVSDGFQATGGAPAGLPDLDMLQGGSINQLAEHATPWTLTIIGVANGDYRVTLYGPRATGGSETGDYFVEDDILPSAALTASSTRSHVVTISDGSINIFRDPTYTELVGSQRYAVSGLQITQVPEPGSFALLSLGGLLILCRRR